MDTQTAPLSAQSATVARWAVLPLILFASAISLFQHYSLTVVAPMVSGSLGLSLSRMGPAFSALAFGMLAGYPIFGFFLNLTGTRYGYPAVVAGSSLATAATASAAGVAGLIVPGALQGFFGGGFAPAAIGLIAEWYPVRFHGLAIGLIQAVLAVAAAVVVPALGKVADSSSWRTVMLLSGGLGFLWLPLWLGLVRSSDSQEPRSFDALGFPQTWALALGLFFLAPFNAFVFTWFPHYARQTFGLTRGWMQWGGLSGMAVVAAVTLAGGLASDQLLSSGWGLRKSLDRCCRCLCPAGFVGRLAELRRRCDAGQRSGRRRDGCVPGLHHRSLRRGCRRRPAPRRRFRSWVGSVLRPPQHHALYAAGGLRHQSLRLPADVLDHGRLSAGGAGRHRAAMCPHAVCRGDCSPASAARCGLIEVWSGGFHEHS